MLGEIGSVGSSRVSAWLSCASVVAIGCADPGPPPAAGAGGGGGDATSASSNQTTGSTVASSSSSASGGGSTSDGGAGGGGGGSTSDGGAGGGGAPSCDEGSTREVACGLNDRGTEIEICSDGLWEVSVPCVDPDTCQDGTADVEACGTGLLGVRNLDCVEGAWVAADTCEAFVSVAAGGYHTCAATAAGEAYCWGSNGYGQVGDGSNTTRNRPRDVGLSGIVAVTAGRRHSCALGSAGQLWCWGLNDGGQLGDGSTTNRTEPTRVVDTALEEAATVATSGAHTCAVDVGGDLYCWGSNGGGRLGDGTNTDRHIPTLIGSNYASVSLGQYHGCAVTTGGAARCWGDNDGGKLGNGSEEDSATPVPVSVIADVHRVAAGIDHSCAVTGSGDVYCWGKNDRRQVGDGTTTTRLTPVSIASAAFADVSDVHAGSRHTCAVNPAGVWCWGHNAQGQVGTGGTTDVGTPTLVLPGGTLVDAGGFFSGNANDPTAFHTCGSTATGGLLCWGDNSLGQLGDGTTTDRTTPTEVSFEP